MSKLNFSPIDTAFMLGSTQIKDTQEEIDKLTKLILDSNVNKSKPKNLKPPEKADGSENPNQSSYMRIGYPDKQTANFNQYNGSDNIDYNLMKVIGHPRFDDIVKNYVLINHPEWMLRDTTYVPQMNNTGTNGTSYFGKSYFGNQYQNTVCSDVKNYVTFFVVCIIVFLMLSAMY